MISPTLIPRPSERLYAQLIDALFAFACVAPGGVVFAIGLGNDWRLTTLLGAVGVLVGIVGATWVQVRLLRDGHTVGKRHMGLRIVHHPTLEPVSLGVSFGMRVLVGQTLLGAIPGIGPLYSFANVLFVFSEHRRCLHDRIAGTVVVDDGEWQVSRMEPFEARDSDERAL